MDESSNLKKEFIRFTAHPFIRSPDTQLINLAEEIAGHGKQRKQRGLPSALSSAGLALTIIPILWLWASIELQDLKNKKTTSTAQRRMSIMLGLQKDHGLTLKEAENLTEKTIAAIEKRDKNDGTIAALINIAKEVKGLVDL